MHNIKLYTIGVYGSTENSFFNALTHANIDTFVDIRQRRGVRGKKYSYVNSIYLQKKLTTLKINYAHIKKLAPSAEIRDIQKKHDLKCKIKKRVRKQLGNAYIKLYKKHCLSGFNLNDFFKLMPKSANTICLFCVERDPKACHRSIAAQFLASKIKLTARHIIL